jgi:hypothetical protein
MSMTRAHHLKLDNDRRMTTSTGLLPVQPSGLDGQADLDVGTTFRSHRSTQPTSRTSTMTASQTQIPNEPIRVPFSQLRSRPDRLLEVARDRRVLLTKQGRIVGELLSLDEPDAAAEQQPYPRLSGALADHLRLRPDADLTEPVDVEWDAQF